MTEYTRENMPDESKTCLSNKEKENRQAAEIFRRRIIYDEKTGDLIWKDCPENQGKIKGKIAGHLNKKTGYRYINLLKNKFMAHRVAWAAYYGNFPSGVIDHVNGKTDDNRIENLRECNYIDNSRNSKKFNHNTSGVSGVCFREKTEKWRAYIGIKGKHVHLGEFSSILEAKERRLEAEMAYGFTSRHGRA